MPFVLEPVKEKSKFVLEPPEEESKFELEEIEPNLFQRIAPAVSRGVERAVELDPVRQSLAFEEKAQEQLRVAERIPLPTAVGAPLQIAADLNILRPSSYIAGILAAHGVGQLASPALTKFATSKVGRNILKKSFPNFAKDLLKRTEGAVERALVPVEGKGFTLRPSEVKVPVDTPKELLKKTLPKKFVKIPEKTGSLRVDKFPQKVRPIIKEAGLEQPPVRTFEQQRATAEVIKDTIDFDTLKPRELFNPEMRRAAALKWVDNGTKALKSGKIEDMQIVYRDLKLLNDVHSEAGRLLGSLRDPLFQQDDDAVRLLADGLRKVVPESKVSLSKFLKDATQPGALDMFFEFRNASLLTSIRTHEKNIIGNTIGRLASAPEKVMAGGADAIRSFVTRQPRERFASEGFADLFGMVKGFNPAYQRALKSLMTDSYSSAARTRETLRFGKAIPGLVGKIVRLPFKALNAMDEFFSTLSQDSSLYTQAWRQAIKEKVPDLFGRTADLAKKPSLEMSAEAARAALKETFRQPLGSAGKSVQRALVKSQIGRFVTPFFRTPVNLFKWEFNRSPLALYQPLTPAFRKLAAGEKADLVGRLAFGQLTSAIMVLSAANGFITGKLSENPEKRKALQRQGIQPYSVKVGDKWVSYRGIEPIASRLGLIANTVEAWKENKKEPTSEKVTKIVFETTKMMAETPFLRGLNDFMGALTNPERFGPRFIQNAVTSTIIPRGLAAIARIDDPIIREPTGIGEAIKAQLPGLSRTIPPKLDVWGNTITREGNLWERAFSPVGRVTQKPDATEEELLSLEKFPSKIAKKYKEIPLSTDERNMITRIEGQITKSILDELIASPEYQSLDSFDREVQVDKTIKIIRTEVRRGFLIPTIVNELKDLKNRQQKMDFINRLIQKNVIK